MAKIARLNDATSHGGFLSSASGHFRNGGKYVCVSGDSHSCPIQGHGVTSVIGSSTVKSNGKNIVKTGDVAGCGAIVTSGGTISTS